MATSTLIDRPIRSGCFSSSCGSSPTRTGFQRALSDFAELPGVDKENVYAVEDVMRRDAKLGQHVLLLDDGGNWRGGGTAWHLAEKGHQVTIVTPDPRIAVYPARTLW